MSQIVKTLHEPFSAGYYTLSGNTIDVDTHHVDFAEVIKSIEKAEKEHGVVFIKELAYCVIRQWEEFKDNIQFFSRCKHMYLVREPKESITSLVKQMRKVYGEDCPLERIEKAVGIQDLISMRKIYDGLTIDSGELTANPEKILKEICDYFALTFDERMLTWEQGSLPDWKIWASKGWHDNAIRSTGFTEEMCKDRENHDNSIEKEYVLRILQKTASPFLN